MLNTSTNMIRGPQSEVSADIAPLTPRYSPEYDVAVSMDVFPAILLNDPVGTG